jgi:hypothetical protein
VLSAPVFDLGDGAVQAARGSLAAAAGAAIVDTPPAAHEPFVRWLSEGSPAFQARCPVVQLVITPAGGKPGDPVQIVVNADCTVEVDPGTHRITFVVVTLSTPTKIDPFTDYIIATYLLPALKDMLNTLFAGIDIPPIDVAGCSFGVTDVNIAQRYVISTATLRSGSNPTTLGSWPHTAFFAVLSPGTAQNAGAYGIGKFNDELTKSGEAKWKDFYAKWHYDVHVGSPRLAVVGGSIAAGFELTGGAGAKAGMKFPPASVGLDFKVTALPEPSGVFGLSIVGGNHLHLQIQRVDPFTVIVTPASKTPWWLVEAFLSIIIDAIVTPLAPAVTRFLQGLRFDIWTIPDFDIHVAGTKITIVPDGLALGGYGNGLIVSGSFHIEGSGKGA